MAMILELVFDPETGECTACDNLLGFFGAGSTWLDAIEDWSDAVAQMAADPTCAGILHFASARLDMDEFRWGGWEFE